MAFDAAVHAVPAHSRIGPEISCTHYTSVINTMEGATAMKNGYKTHFRSKKCV